MSDTATTPVPSAESSGRSVDVRRPAKSRYSVSRTLKFAALIFFVLVVLTPVYVLFVTSFKGPGDASPVRAWNLPETWTIENWIGAWNALAPAIGRSFLIVIPSAIISAFLGSMNGYVLSLWTFRGANLVFTLILFGMFIPYQSVMIPLLQIMLGAGIPSGVPALILLHIIYGIPITTLIFRNYYQTVPRELIEAGRVDGAGMLRTYWSIILPISIPSFVGMGLGRALDEARKLHIDADVSGTGTVIAQDPPAGTIAAHTRVKLVFSVDARRISAP